MQINHCLRCNHEWPSKLEKSRTCSKCRSPYWDVPKGTVNKPVADFLVENKKNSAASPTLEDPVMPERYDMYFEVQKKLHPERTEADKLAFIEQLRAVANKDNYVKDAAYYKKSILPDYGKPVEDQPDPYQETSIDFTDV